MQICTVFGSKFRANAQIAHLNAYIWHIILNFQLIFCSPHDRVSALNIHAEMDEFHGDNPMCVFIHPVKKRL